jgi:hypothetical protein
VQGRRGGRFPRLKARESGSDSDEGRESVKNNSTQPIALACMSYFGGG